MLNKKGEKNLLLLHILQHASCSGTKILGFVEVNKKRNINTGILLEMIFGQELNFGNRQAWKE